MTRRALGCSAPPHTVQHGRACARPRLGAWPQPQQAQACPSPYSVNPLAAVRAGPPAVRAASRIVSGPSPAGARCAAPCALRCGSSAARARRPRSGPARAPRPPGAPRAARPARRNARRASRGSTCGAPAPSAGWLLPAATGPARAASLGIAAVAAQRCMQSCRQSLSCPATPLEAAGALPHTLWASVAALYKPSHCVPTGKDVVISAHARQSIDPTTARECAQPLAGTRERRHNPHAHTRAHSCQHAGL